MKPHLIATLSLISYGQPSFRKYVGLLVTGSLTLFLTSRWIFLPEIFERFVGSIGILMIAFSLGGVREILHFPEGKPILPVSKRKQLVLEIVTFYALIVPGATFLNLLLNFFKSMFISIDVATNLFLTLVTIGVPVILSLPLVIAISHNRLFIGITLTSIPLFISSLLQWHQTISGLVVTFLLMIILAMASQFVPRINFSIKKDAAILNRPYTENPIKTDFIRGLKKGLIQGSALTGIGWALILVENTNYVTNHPMLSNITLVVGILSIAFGFIWALMKSLDLPLEAKIKNSNYQPFEILPFKKGEVQKCIFWHTALIWFLLTSLNLALMFVLYTLVSDFSKILGVEITIVIQISLLHLVAWESKYQYSPNKVFNWGIVLFGLLFPITLWIASAAALLYVQEEQLEPLRRLLGVFLPFFLNGVIWLSVLKIALNMDITKQIK